MENLKDQITESIKIEKGIPIPNRKYSLGRSSNDELLEKLGLMEVGDSIALDIPTENSKKWRDNIASRALMYGKKRNIKFSTRAVENNQLRIWRIQ